MVFFSPVVGIGLAILCALGTDDGDIVHDPFALIEIVVLPMLIELVGFVRICCNSGKGGVVTC